MTPPDFDAMAKEWLERHEQHVSSGSAMSLSALLRSVHAAGREAGVREAADTVNHYKLTQMESLAIRRRILALLPEPKP